MTCRCNRMRSANVHWCQDFVEKKRHSSLKLKLKTMTPERGLAGPFIGVGLEWVGGILIRRIPYALKNIR